jgi:hypothetical protein
MRHIARGRCIASYGSPHRDSRSLAGPASKGWRSDRSVGMNALVAAARAAARRDPTRRDGGCDLRHISLPRERSPWASRFERESERGCWV